MMVKLWTVLVASILVLGCGGEDSAAGEDEDTESGTGIPGCQESQTRCTDDFVQSCSDGVWVDFDDCAGQGLECAVIQGEAQCIGSTDTETGTDTDTDTSTECTPEQAAACDANASCELVTGNPVCTCNGGWTGSGTICVNVNECTAGTDDCHLNASCEDTQGSFDCTCNEYYFGTGTECYAIDPEVYVRDISDLPIRIELSGVGDYDVHAMGRLAVEFDYVSIPGVGIRMERTPTSWQIHDLVLRDIQARSSSDIADLVIWAGTSIPLSGTIYLDGLGFEFLEINLFDMVPASSDTNVVSGQMAELVISIGNWDKSSYTPPQESPSPGNSTQIDINGIECMQYYFPADLDEALPDTADPIHQRKVPRNGWGTAENFIDWFDYNIGYFEGWGDIERKAMSEIHFDASVMEIDRYNCFEVFPYLIYFFNPAKIYGSSYLIDMSIATEFCEHG